jgi:hypothetical protein
VPLPLHPWSAAIIARQYDCLANKYLDKFDIKYPKPGEFFCSPVIVLERPSTLVLYRF